MLKHVALGALFCGLCVAATLDALANHNAWLAALGAVFAVLNGGFVVIACMTANDLEPRVERGTR